jgi:hypothetical protein
MMVLRDLDNKPVGPSKTSLTAASLDNMVKQRHKFPLVLVNCLLILLLQVKVLLYHGAIENRFKTLLSRFITIGFPCCQDLSI